MNSSDLSGRIFHLPRLFKPFGLLDLRGKWILLFPEIWQNYFCVLQKSFYSDILCLFLGIGIGILRVATLPWNTGLTRQKPEVKSS